jgi:hypothetical protein
MVGGAAHPAPYLGTAAVTFAWQAFDDPQAGMAGENLEGGRLHGPDDVEGDL